MPHQSELAKRLANVAVCYEEAAWFVEALVGRGDKFARCYHVAGGRDLRRSYCELFQKMCRMARHLYGGCQCSGSKSKISVKMTELVAVRQRFRCRRRGASPAAKFCRNFNILCKLTQAKLGGPDRKMHVRFCGDAVSDEHALNNLQALEKFCDEILNRCDLILAAGDPLSTLWTNVFVCRNCHPSHHERPLEADHLRLH